MSTQSDPVLTGSCRCCHVTYTSTLPPEEFTNCYCQTCRKLSGAPFLTFGRFPTSAVTWTSGEKSLTKRMYSDIAERTHCASCGSPMSMQYKFQLGLIHLTAGTIDEDSVKTTLPKVTDYVFVEEVEKTGWYEVPIDKVTKYSKFPPRFQKKIDDWKKALLTPGSGLG